jgi:hypothetical protein
VELYLEVLNEQKKFAKSVQVIEGPLGNSFKLEREKLQFLANLQISQENWPRANELFRHLLTEK